MESIKNTNRYFGKQLSGIIFVVFGLSFLSQPSLALPPEIRTDILLITAQKYSEEKNYKKALENLEKIFALEVDPPESAYYHYGKALGNAGRHNDGIEQIKEYLSKFGKHGKYYDPALQVLAEMEVEKDESTTEKKRKENERKKLCNTAIRQIKIEEKRRDKISSLQYGEIRRCEEAYCEKIDARLHARIRDCRMICISKSRLKRDKEIRAYEEALRSKGKFCDKRRETNGVNKDA